MAEWDLFVSHASENKRGFVTPLVAQLQEHVKVWVDVNEIQAGDSIREKIDFGLANSRWGIVILSHQFFSPKKRWTSSELGALFSTNRNRIIPVWLNISKGYLFGRSPLLADIAAYKASDGVDVVAKRIIQRVTHRAIYDHQETMRRLDALVTAKGANPSALFVAIGKGDFVSSWLPRLLERIRIGKRNLRFSRLVILSLAVNTARKLESRGELAPGFTELMLSNINVLKDAFHGPIEWREWAGEPSFHGFIFSDSAIVGKWDRDGRGRLHVMTQLEELQKDLATQEFANHLMEFSRGKLLYQR